MGLNPAVTVDLNSGTQLVYRGVLVLTAALDVSVHHLWADAVRPFLAGRMSSEEALEENG